MTKNANIMVPLLLTFFSLYLSMSNFKKSIETKHLRKLEKRFQYSLFPWDKKFHLTVISVHSE